MSAKDARRSELQTRLQAERSGLQAMQHELAIATAMVAQAEVNATATAKELIAQANIQRDKQAALQTSIAAIQKELKTVKAALEVAEANVAQRTNRLVPVRVHTPHISCHAVLCAYACIRV